MHNNHYGFRAISENIRVSCASLKEPIRKMYNLKYANNLWISYLTCKSPVLTINWTQRKRTLYQCHVYTIWKNTVRKRELTVLPFIKMQPKDLSSFENKLLWIPFKNKNVWGNEKKYRIRRNKTLKKIVHKCVSYHFLTEWKCSLFKEVILLYDTIHLSAWAV